MDIPRNPFNIENNTQNVKPFTNPKVVKNAGVAKKAVIPEQILCVNRSVLVNMYYSPCILFFLCNMNVTFMKMSNFLT